MKTPTTQPRVYCGTYAKYNSGSIAGAWLTLSDYADKAELLEACAELHKDEADPEFMFQDFEGFPRAYYSECSVADELWTEFLALDECERAAFALFVEHFGDSATESDFREAYQGTCDSEADFAENMATELGEIPKDLPTWLVIDWQASWDGGLRFDYWCERDSDRNLHFFRNV